ncbi:MAG: cytochrome d ubiquinol oxidase subunit II [Acidobacteriota bacterium]|jgi:cytochrome d ubiquinol oxidase subunit II
MLPTVWFCLVAVMITMYVIFDGFDLGVGAVYLLAGRDPGERRLLLRSIGPVWDGNEVWLLAAGGTLYFAFPRLYAVSFSGFYLPLIMVLWLLMGRGVAIELRSHLDDPLWKSAWDAVFSVSSALLALFFGVALGNVVRGVPIGADGYFFSPLWTDFRLGEERGIIDWYTLLSGVTALLALSLHGALWAAFKTAGEVNRRTAAIARSLWWPVVVTTVLLSLVSFAVQPKIGVSFAARPWGVFFPLAALTGLLAMRRFAARGDELRAFLGSCAYLFGMLTSVVFGLYPWVLPAGPDTSRSLTVTEAATAAYGLSVGLLWWIPGMLLVAGYFLFTYRSFAGKVEPSESGHYG